MARPVASQVVIPAGLFEEMDTAPVALSHVAPAGTVPATPALPIVPTPSIEGAPMLVIAPSAKPAKQPSKQAAALPNRKHAFVIPKDAAISPAVFLDQFTAQGVMKGKGDDFIARGMLYDAGESYKESTSYYYMAVVAYVLRMGNVTARKDITDLWADKDDAARKYGTQVVRLCELAFEQGNVRQLLSVRTVAELKALGVDPEKAAAAQADKVADAQAKQAAKAVGPVAAAAEDDAPPSFAAMQAALAKMESVIASMKGTDGHAALSRAFHDVKQAATV